jgi:hypothetical protein
MLNSSYLYFLHSVVLLLISLFFNKNTQKHPTKEETKIVRGMTGRATTHQKTQAPGTKALK